LKTAAANVPRFHYNPETKECLGLLVERSALNYITDSRMLSTSADPFATAASGISKTYITNQITPAGVTETTGIFKMMPNSLTNVIKYMLRAETWTPGIRCVFSAFFKLTNSATAIYPCLIMDDGVNGGVFARFDLVNGTVLQGQATSGNATYINSGIEKLPNGWARCWVCGVPASGSGGRASITIRNNTASSNGYDPAWTASNTTDGVYVLWPQIEKVVSIPRPSSYVPSNGSFFQRAAESASAPMTSWFNQEEGSFLVEYNKSFSGNYLGYNHPFSVNDSAGASNNNIILYNIQDSSVITNFSMRYNGVDQLDYFQATVYQGINKALHTYKKNEVIFAVNGVHAGTDYSANIPTLNTIRIGSDGFGNNNLDDCVSRIIYYPIALGRQQAVHITFPALF
jgi:hypothetical protein